MDATLGTPDQHLINRLRKVLALTSSPMEHEAQLAAERLRELLTKHNLDMADLEEKGGRVPPSIHEAGHDLGKAAFKWKLDLAEGISEFYYCVGLVNRYSKTVTFVGRPDNVESLKLLYNWIIEQVKKIAAVERRKHYDSSGEHIDPLRWQVSFGEGVVERLIDRLREMKARQVEDEVMSHDMFGNVTSLILHHQAEVSDFLEQKYGYRKDGRLTKAQQERRAQWDKEREEEERAEAEKEAMRIQCTAMGDMTPYYERYPDEHPDRVAERVKWQEQRRKREERNARRRTGRWSAGPRVDERKEEQSERARRSGRESAKNINLQPFLKGGSKPKGELK